MTSRMALLCGLYWALTGVLLAQPLPTTAAVVTDAVGFGVEYGDGYKLLHVTAHWDAPSAPNHRRSYLLLPRESKGEPPAAYADLPIIRTPVQRMIVSSPTQSVLLAELGATDVLIGHANDSVWDPELNARLQDGRVAVVGRGAALNLEMVLALRPDMLMSTANQSEGSHAYSIIEQAGIAVIPNSEYLEQTLLGRAEWLKLMAVLLDKEAEANRIFNQVKDEYGKLKARVANVRERPLLMANSPNQGNWFMAGGNSYEARLFADAGGNYRWKDDNHVGSLSIAYEQAMQLGLEADVWFNPRVESGLLSDLVALDARLAELKPFKTGQVYSFINRVTPTGANDYWEAGIVYPNRTLADLIHILHPHLLPEHELFFYRQLQ